MTASIVPNPGERPRLRGVLHQWAAVASAGAGLTLVLMAPTARARAAAAVFALSLLALFVVSSVYHRITWRPRARAWMRRADHAAIFVLIAGTYTPLCLLALDAQLGKRIALIAWVGAVAGVAQALLWVRAPKVLTALLYLGVGWTLAPWFPEVSAALRPVELAFLIAGGVLYSAGAAVYALRRPRLFPRVFGYHEVFHALTVVAALAHFATVALLIRRMAGA